MMQSQPRPQDRLRLREDAPRSEERLIEPRSAALWTVLSLPLVGYFFWYTSPTATAPSSPRTTPRTRGSGWR